MEVSTHVDLSKRSRSSDISLHLFVYYSVSATWDPFRRNSFLCGLLQVNTACLWICYRWLVEIVSQKEVKAFNTIQMFVVGKTS